MTTQQQPHEAGPDNTAGKMLKGSERATIRQAAETSSLLGQRASALLALDEGATHAATADLSGLTLGQVKYLIRKFGKERMAMFPSSAAPDAVLVLAADAETVAEVKKQAKKKSSKKKKKSKKDNKGKKSKKKDKKKSKSKKSSHPHQHPQDGHSPPAPPCCQGCE